jgi:hypothetical protein
MPQALNRYTAAPLGQPGVAEASIASLLPLHPATYQSHQIAAAPAQTSLTMIALRDASLQAGLGYIAGELIERTAGGALTIITSTRTWYRTIGHSGAGLRALFRQPSVAQPHVGTTFRAYTTLGRVRDLGNGRYLAQTGQVIETGGLPRSAQVNFSPQWRPDVRMAAGASFAFGLSAAFQWIGDFNNPYLTTNQQMGRLVASGAGGLVALGAAQVASGAVAGSWAGPVGVIVGASTTFVWIKWVQPIVFDSFGLNPERTLLPLQD